MTLPVSGNVRIITDPSLHSFDSGTVVCNFAGGIYEGKDKDGNYINNAIDIEMWGKSAEIIVDRCKKGDYIFVIGNIRRQEWIDKKTNEKRTKHVLVANRFEFLPRNNKDEDAF
jgi:single-strand DNA-binding protein